MKHIFNNLISLDIFFFIIKNENQPKYKTCLTIHLRFLNGQIFIIFPYLYILYLNYVFVLFFNLISLKSHFPLHDKNDKDHYRQELFYSLLKYMYLFL